MNVGGKASGCRAQDVTSLPFSFLFLFLALEYGLTNPAKQKNLGWHSEKGGQSDNMMHVLD